MPNTQTLGQELQGQVLDAVRKSQEAVVNAIRTWADTVQAISPSLPSVPSVPFADKLPRPGELVASAYDFAEQLLTAQRKFAEEVLDATAPVLTAAGVSPAKNGHAAQNSRTAK
jgi:hypothetical protein